MGGLAYAAGGEAEEEDGRGREVVGIGGALAALALLNPRTRAWAAKKLNKATLPMRRAMTRPSFATETVSDFPLDEVGQRARLGQARMNLGSKHPLAQLPFEEGQGAWLDQGELSTPLVFGQALPRNPGALRDADALINYASDMGRRLDQQAVPLSRHMQTLFDDPHGANALVASNVSKGVLKQIAQELGDKAVVAHKPGGDALVHGFGDPTPQEIEEILAHARKRLPGVKFRHAVSDPGLDRILIGDPEYATMPYRTKRAAEGFRSADRYLLTSGKEPEIFREFLGYGPERRVRD